MDMTRQDADAVLQARPHWQLSNVVGGSDVFVVRINAGGAIIGSGSAPTHDEALILAVQQALRATERGIG